MVYRGVGNLRRATLASRRRARARILRRPRPGLSLARLAPMRRVRFVKRKRSMRMTRRKKGALGRHTAFLSIYKNPFSKSMLSPKIPDGRALLSVGQRLQSSQEFTMAKEGLMTFVLFPGLGNAVRVLGCTLAPTVNDYAYQPFRNHGDWFRANEDIQKNDPNDPNKITSSIGSWVYADPLTAWRLVSCGLRLSLTNNAEENDGWWECIRIPISADTREWALVGGPTEAGRTATVERPLNVTQVDPLPFRICPASNFGGGNVIDTVVNTSFVDHPTYMSGKLSRIHKILFQLKPSDTTHPFVKMDNGFAKDAFGIEPPGNRVHTVPFTIDANGAYVPGAGDTSYPTYLSSGNSSEAHDFKNMNVDPSYDALIIRIHGRSSATNPTRILSHVVSNQETIFSEGSAAARLQTNSEQRQPISSTALASVVAATM